MEKIGVLTGVAILEPTVVIGPSPKGDLEDESPEGEEGEE